MDDRQTTAKQFADQLAEIFSQELYGPDGPDLDCDVDQLEEIAVNAARAAFDAVLARALRLQNLKLPDQLPCPKCETLCDVRRESRTVQGRMGTAEIQEPVCRCPKCDRDFFPSTGNAEVGQPQRDPAGAA